jgi:nitronate monooxygenase
VAAAAWQHSRVVLAPMAGGPSTVALAAAVCEAGGVGFLAAGYLTPEQVSDRIDELRALTSAPFGVNVFLARPRPADPEPLQGYLRSLQAEARRLGVEVGEPLLDDDWFDGKLELLLDARAPVVSFTFGCPAPETVSSLHAGGSRVWVTVTSADEAKQAVAAGCDAVVAQGAQAGGHRGSFADDGGVGALGTLELVGSIRQAVDVPVVAAGGIADAGDVRAARRAGAVAAQSGTAFLDTTEAGTHAVHRAAVGGDRPTGFTRSFSGRTARGVENAFMREHADAPVAYPQIHHATSPIRAAARMAGDGERVNLWAGTRHGLTRPGPAADVARELLDGSG